MKTEKQSRIIPFTLGLVAILMSMFLVVAGCSSQVAEVEEDNNAAEAEIEDENDDDSAAEVETEEVEIAREDTKTEEDKVAEQTEQALEDGQHVTEVSYVSPGGTDTFEITLETEADVVTSVSLAVVKAHDVSTNYINGVNEALPDLVVGKSINEIELPKQISGSSLTTAAVQKHLNTLSA